MTPDVVRAFVGDQQSLKLFVSRVPRLSGASLGPSGVADVNNVESDQKLIVYWLAGGQGGGRASGLARYEVALSTATPEGLPSVVGSGDESRYVIAPEVTSVSFSYFDGSGWSSSWDSREIGPDEATPIGPPMAIAIEFELETPGLRGADPTHRKFRHVINVPTASGKPITNDNSSMNQEP